MKMKVAIDINTFNKIKEKDKYEYIIAFDKEDVNDLIKTKAHCIRYDLIDAVDINLTDYDIEAIKKANIEDENWYELPKVINHKFAIIVPNYNYEHTIKKCLDSIFNQTYTNYEIIFVDDMSTDDSVKITKQLYEDKLLSDDEFGILKIVQLKQKRLNGGARNEAYLHISEDVDYIYYVDSDDWLYDDTSLEKINRALINEPDVLFVGLADYKNGKTDIVYTPMYKDKYEAIQGWSGSCGKVIKKSLATRQECLYPEGTLKEDRTQHRKICIYMNSFDILKKPVYVWNRVNTKSVTTIRDNIIWGTSTIRHYADTLQLALSVKGQDEKIDRILEDAVKKCKKEMESDKDRQW
jgi:glycosyltransferase involved in cell wall biosynthesis